MYKRGGVVTFTGPLRPPEALASISSGKGIGYAESNQVVAYGDTRYYSKVPFYNDYWSFLLAKDRLREKV